jgi:hypothetical protein
MGVVSLFQNIRPELFLPLLESIDLVSVVGLGVGSLVIPTRIRSGLNSRLVLECS